MNQYPEAEAAALRALAIQPKDGWAVHAAVHVMEMQGRIDEGIAFLSSREADWAPGNGFAYHNFCIWPTWTARITTGRSICSIVMFIRNRRRICCR